MRFVKLTVLLLIALYYILIITSTEAAQPSRKSVSINTKDGVLCVILPYDFDSTEKEFPRLDLPDNAMLTLAGESTGFRPELFTVVQNGKTYRPVGMFGYYFWGEFYAIWFEADFNKYLPFEARAGDGLRVLVDASAISRLRGGAKPSGRRPWEDPVTETSVMSTPPIQLPDLLARGRALEYSNEALGLRGKGGLALVRVTAIKALEQKDYPRAACLAGEALRWSNALEAPDVRPIANFQDWVTVARAFAGIGQPLAAVRAYDEALKIHKEKIIQQERDTAWQAYSRKGPGPTAGPYRESLSEAELAIESHGSIPIPAGERGIIREGLSAEGVFIGDTKERIRSQCGTPTEAFSGMLLYLDHPACPEAVFFNGKDRAYAIRALKGKTTKGVSVGDPISKAITVYGQPDHKEVTQAEGNQKPTTRWIYLRQRIAFVDMTGNGTIDAVDIFDYSLCR